MGRPFLQGGGVAPAGFDAFDKTHPRLLRALFMDRDHMVAFNPRIWRLNRKARVLRKDRPV
jgi:hypothetical protein